MHIDSLNICGLRCLRQLNLKIGREINVLVGKNGSGKTSVLEAVSLLLLGRSFRTRHFEKLVNIADEAILLNMSLWKDAENYQIGYKRGLDSKKIARINRKEVETAAELAKLLPFILIDTNIFSEFQTAPKNRRKHLDWGMFHVEHMFYDVWKKYNEILAQRNAAVKKYGFSVHGNDFINMWNRPLSQEGELLIRLREKYLARIYPWFKKYLEKLLPAYSEIQLQFEKGWSGEHSLEQELNLNLEYEKKIGYTLRGAHKFDLKFIWSGQNAQDILSRGQYKLMVLAFLLSLVRDLHEQGLSCLLLLDELAAELDSANQVLIFEQLQELGCQVIATALNQEIVPKELGEQKVQLITLD